MLGDHKVMGVGLGQKKGCEKFCWTSGNQVLVLVLQYWYWYCNICIHLWTLGNQADQEGSVIVAMYG